MFVCVLIIGFLFFCCPPSLPSPYPLLPPLFLFFSSVSPELLGVLSSIAAFMALMALFFLYLSNKLSVESPDDLSHLSGYKNSQPGKKTHLEFLYLHTLHTFGLLDLLWFYNHTYRL